MKRDILEELLNTIESKAKNNMATITDVELFVESWRKEAINYAHSSTLLNNSFYIGEKVLIKSCREVEISNFCEDGERVEIVDGCDYMLIDIEDLTKIV